MATEYRVEMCAHVVACAGELRQHQVACHHYVFGRGRYAAQAETHGFGAFVHVAAGAQVQIFAMIDHGQIESRREFHGAAHHARIHHGPAVVGDSHRAGRLHAPDGRQFHAFAALGDGADGEDVDHREATRALHDIAGDGGAVIHRLGVRHAARRWK